MDQDTNSDHPKTRKNKKNRRGLKRREQGSEKLVITGTNANGLKTKQESFINHLEVEKPHVFMVQETKMKKENQISVHGYGLYEKIRKEKDGGSVMIGFKKDMEGIPVVVSNHDNDVEILVVEVALKALTIRFLTAYGPQEDASDDTINKFYCALEEEIIKCEQENCGLIAELDCNAKLGKEIIDGDPNVMSSNGKLFWEILERQECTVVNITTKCSGTITRSRKKGGKQEESILDYFVVNKMIAPYIHNMEIDESKAKALTRYTKKSAIPSDHNMLTCTFNIPIKRKYRERKEVFRLRNHNELQLFRERTSDTRKFTQCFTETGDVKTEGKKWMNELQKMIRTTFKKIRIRKCYRAKSETQQKVEKRKELLKKIQNTRSATVLYQLEDELSIIEEEISDDYRHKQMEKLEDHLNAITGPDGKVNVAGAWKLRRKVCPRPLEQLTSKMDKEGNIVTNPERLKQIYIEAYTERLQHREILPHLQEYKTLREEAFQYRLMAAKENKSPPWTMDQLENVLKKLKKGKATDPLGLVNELFMLDNIGTDLKESVLLLMNKIKDQMTEPEFMEMANITSFWKGKGSKNDIENERGIFILTILRLIKDRLIHCDAKGEVKMSDSQVGGRDEYNIRNHLFVLYSILNSVTNNEAPAIDIHMYDLRKCFDGLWLEECINNLYEAGLQDDKLAMIYEGNKTNRVAIKTPGGMTERVTIERIVTQGGVTGPLCCSVQTDDIGRKSLESGEHLYLYKGTVGIPTLAMVDDLAKVSECGVESVKDNAYINAKIEQDKQSFNGTKCHHMHVGKPSPLCPVLKAHSTEMDIVSQEKYVGDIVSFDGKHTKNIAARRSKGIGMTNEIMAILNSMFLGSHYFKVALMLRQAMLVQVLLTNSETWLRLSKENMKKLEGVDLLLLRKLLRTPISTPKAGLYLETGCVPLCYIIKARRIMFLHHILTRDDNALISRVFWAQVHKPAKGDWCKVVREDLDDVGLTELSFEQIKEMSKEKLKDLVNDHIRSSAFNQLQEDKMKLSKIASKTYDKLDIQPYLTDATVPVRLMILTFRWRMRMINVGWNFGKKEKCPLCLKEDDTQSHLLYCEKLEEDNTTTTNCNSLNSEQYDQTTHIQQLEKAIRKREVILENRKKMTMPNNKDDKGNADVLN